MTDEELAAQSGSVPTMYFDSFGHFRKINGVLRCVGYVLGGGAQLNLVMSLAGTEVAMQEARRVLDEHPIKGIAMWGGVRVAH